MYQKKLLILLYKKVIIILFFVLFGCSNFVNYNKEITDQFYITNINEHYGMLLKFKLNSVFNNTDINKANYILEVNLKTQDSLYLNSRAGYATKGLLTISFSYNIKNKIDNTIITSYSSSLSESYNIESNPLATKTNSNKAIENLINSISSIIITRINFFIKNNYENFSK